MGCSNPGPAITVQVPAYIPQPGKAVITAVRYSVVTASKALFVGTLYAGSSEPPPQVPPVTICPGQQLKATATIENIGEGQDTFYIRGYLSINASGMPHQFFMDAQQYGVQVCEDYWLIDHAIQICFIEARLTLNPNTKVSVDFISKQLPTIQSLDGVSWIAGRFVNNKYVFADHQFMDVSSVKYQP